MRVIQEHTEGIVLEGDGWMLDRVSGEWIWSIAGYTYDILAVSAVVTERSFTVLAMYPDNSLRHWCDHVSTHTAQPHIRNMIEAALRVAGYIR